MDILIGKKFGRANRLIYCEISFYEVAAMLMDKKFRVNGGSVIRIVMGGCLMKTIGMKKQYHQQQTPQGPSFEAAGVRVPTSAVDLMLCLVLFSKEKLKWEIENVMADIQDFESSEENKVLERGKQINNGKKKFNMDPKKGVNYLVQNNLLEWNSQRIAEFLYKEEGLNKTAIGDFLGEREEMHLQTLKSFVELHEFSDLNLVQALRQFLWSFRLPGEAQKIDRMMEAFATRYCECNLDVFQSTDTCYILSFAIIMLNTSLHNPNVKDKTTLERFISMNRGINNGEDLSNELLTSFSISSYVLLFCHGFLQKLYDSIRNEPFKIPEDDGNDLTHTFFNPDREGWLLKLGGRVKTWKRRWFILTDNCLYYFEYTTDKEPRGIIPLENLCVREVIYTRKPVFTGPRNVRVASSGFFPLPKNMPVGATASAYGKKESSVVYPCVPLSVSIDSV
ncbi:Cytohesin-3 [Bagarius yarrelli]|uniref:Cytohesin-3 n=1 Tax=Bagarius yarrelli TaxID=175774 RepID=A0A556TTH7_BAGYA|nr:Cytohesin-3 [Bagarius yarrelli]